MNIGDFVHYNCAGSKAIGLVVETWKYHSRYGHNNRRTTLRLQNGDYLIRVEWLSDGLKPTVYFPPHAHDRGPKDVEYPPLDKQAWYCARFFKIISSRQ